MKFNKVAIIFFANWFYALCACALVKETILVLNLNNLSIKYWLFIAAATIFYYTIAYAFSNTNANKVYNNERLLWYHQHTKFVKIQLLLCLVAMLPVCIAIIENASFLVQNHIFLLLTSCLFPIIGILYYGSFIKIKNILSLRNWGLAKPFIVANVWAGIVTIYPLVFSLIQYKYIDISYIDIGYHFINNTMYIALLCILFDMKDYVSDYNQQIKTFVVKWGVFNTIKYLIIPLSILGCIISVIILQQQHYSPVGIAINSIAFVVLWSVLYIFNHKKSIAFYLIVIDGLMLVKAICGIVSYQFLNI